MKTLGPSVNRYRNTLDEYRHALTPEPDGAIVAAMRGTRDRRTGLLRVR